MGFRWVPTARVAGDGIDTMRNWPRKTSDSTAWWTRGRVSNRSCRDYLFSETYCGGYSGEDPPLPIPNREVKLTIADGTAPPGGRVGSCHFLIRHPVINGWRGVLLYTGFPMKTVLGVPENWQLRSASVKLERIPVQYSTPALQVVCISKPCLKTCLSLFGYTGTPSSYVESLPIIYWYMLRFYWIWCLIMFIIPEYIYIDSWILSFLSIFSSDPISTGHLSSPIQAVVEIFCTILWITIHDICILNLMYFSGSSRSGEGMCTICHYSLQLLISL